MTVAHLLRLNALSSHRTHRLSPGRAVALVLTGLLLIVSRTAFAEPLTDEVEPPSSYSLQRAVALARENAPAVLVGRAAMRTSQTSLIGARLWPIQNPNLEVTGTRSTTPAADSTMFLGTAWLPFEFTGQRSKRIARAEAYIDMYGLQLAQAQAMATAIAVRSWGRAMVEAQRIHTLSEIARSAESEAKAFGVRRDVGDTTEREAQVAQVEFARHKMLVEEARVSLASAIGELRRVTGREFRFEAANNVRPDYNIEKLRPDAAAAESPYVQANRAEAVFHEREEATLAAEATGPISLMLSGGKGTVGETTLGAGLAFTLPTFRRFQGERARALAERDRAYVQASTTRKDIEAQLVTVLNETRSLRRASAVLETEALPAARAARLAAEKMFEMGKIDTLAVLVSRRDESLLQLRRFDFAAREWELMADWIELTGVVP